MIKRTVSLHLIEPWCHSDSYQTLFCRFHISFTIIVLYDMPPFLQLNTCQKNLKQNNVNNNNCRVFSSTQLTLPAGSGNSGCFLFYCYVLPMIKFLSFEFSEGDFIPVPACTSILNQLSTKVTLFPVAVKADYFNSLYFQVQIKENFACQQFLPDFIILEFPIIVGVSHCL